MKQSTREQTVKELATMKMLNWQTVLQFLLFLLILLLSSAKLTLSVPLTPTYAVNCGGPTYHSKINNIRFLSDRGYSNGVAANSGAAFAPFPRVEDDTIYLSEHFDNRSFSYKVPIVKQGIHTIVLMFSEVFFRDANAKVFNLRIGGHLVVQNLDIFSRVGRGVPHHEYVEVERRGLILLVNGKVVTSGWNAHLAEAVIEFEKIEGRDNPKVNAIVVYNAPIADVPKLPRWTPDRAKLMGQLEAEVMESSAAIDVVEIYPEDEDLDIRTLLDNHRQSAASVTLVGVFVAVGLTAVMWILGARKNTTLEKKERNR